ncbi:hypothetical protein JCM19237_729 [Photobacterium aphoticum]|uniref:Uncharacterized protein n=1 Tax=Photobacterium aphoticum TaxID=754436 RepID=A0A090R445_9GAMM|nr:hypothetical protein JCM19237_729 [Photobacterium aphoticum]
MTHCRAPDLTECDFMLLFHHALLSHLRDILFALPPSP